MDALTIKGILHKIGWRNLNVTDRLLELLAKFISYLDEESIQIVPLCLSLKDLIEYLCSHEGNTDSNCRAVDYVLTFRYETLDKKNLPLQLKEIIEDLMGSLHDVHKYPEIAKLNNAMPSQLLERIQKIMTVSF